MPDDTLPEGVTRRRTATICDGMVIRYEFACNWANTPEVNASRNGVSLCGSWPVFKTLEKFRAVLDLAWGDYEALREDPDAR